MALRITKTSLAATEDVSARATLTAGEQSASLLVSRADVALQSGDHKAFLEAFTAAAEIEHETPRYRARKKLVELGLSRASGLSERHATQLLLATAHGAIGAIEADPLEPVLLNYAGVVLYELWCLDGARALFNAAKRLDPEVPHVDRNLKALSERNRSHHHSKALLHPALRELGKRAKQVAPRAKPADGMRISLCMIMRDEEEMLERTLAAVAPVVDEMVIVDTGSQDRSIEIAKSFGANVIEREWTGDFSAARNVSLDAATGDWILWLDADEVLVADDADRLRALAGHTWREAIFFNEINFTGSEEMGVSVMHAAMRLLRNRPEYRFTGRLHEQIADKLPGDLPERIWQSSVRIEHYGYLGVVRDSKEKSSRNLELLLKQKDEGAPTAFLHYNLGSEYFAIGETETALAEFEESWNVIEAEQTTHHEFVPSLAVRIVKALRAAGRNEDAIERAEVALDRFHGFTDLVYEQGLAALSIDREDDAVGYLEKAISMGDAPSKYTAMVGAGTFMPRIILAVRHMRRGEINQAVSMMQWCIEHHPNYFGVLHPYATALLKAGHPADEIVDEVERRAGRVTPTMRFMLGTALFEQGAASAAESQFEQVLEAQPHSGPARAALVEALLYQRRYSEAAAAAAMLDESDNRAATVVRSELFGLLLSGDVAGAGQALERAARVGLPSAEQSMFSSWIAQAEGSGQATQIPTGAVPLLELMLEALLRVQDFESFETVHGLFMSAQLPTRERRERLAQMYMRRGFLKSAGREWMAVCEEQPDTRALVGLAQVALASGQPESARGFADAALNIDPGNAVASAVLDTVREPVAA
jgi:tetratricopeptide (TPR) repeat protein